jgi:hypothetical protein
MDTESDLPARAATEVQALSLPRGGHAKADANAASVLREKFNAGLFERALRNFAGGAAGLMDPSFVPLWTNHEQTWVAKVIRDAAS